MKKTNRKRGQLKIENSDDPITEFILKTLQRFREIDEDMEELRDAVNMLIDNINK